MNKVIKVLLDQTVIIGHEQTALFYL